MNFFSVCVCVGGMFRGQQGMGHQNRHYKGLKYPTENKIMSYKL